MTRFSPLLTLLLLGLLAFGAAPVSAQDIKSMPVITWFGGNYPPTFIASGDKKGEGYGDKALAFLFDELSAYRNVRVSTTFNRGLVALRERDGSCMFGVIKTAEREQQYHFSNAISATLPNRVIMRKDRAAAIQPFLDARGEVVLEKLVFSSGLRLGLITDRFYSPHINTVIDRAQGSASTVELPAPRYGTLLYHRRIDYTFGFPYEAAFQFAELGAPDAFISFPIAGEPKLLYAHVACSKTSLGAEVIAGINAAAAAPGAQQRLYGFFTEWLDDAAKTDFWAALAAE